MNSDELKARSKKFAIDIIKFFDSFESNSKCIKVITNQLIRSSTSVGANYRAACRGRSHAEFISKIKIVEEESDESQYWLEVLIGADIVKEEQVGDLMNEAKQLTAIFSASAKTARSNKLKMLFQWLFSFIF